MRPIWLGSSQVPDSITTFTIDRGGLLRMITHGIDNDSAGTNVCWGFLHLVGSKVTLADSFSQDPGTVRTDILSAINTQGGYDMPIITQFCDVRIDDRQRVYMTSQITGGVWGTFRHWAILWFDVPPEPLLLP